MEGFERVLATINEVFVFKIPPQQSSAGHRCVFPFVVVFCCLIM
jgi:hypothetical protein